MAIIALHCPHIKVIVADINKKQIEKWNSGRPHSHTQLVPAAALPHDADAAARCVVLWQTCCPSTSRGWTRW